MEVSRYFQVDRTQPFFITLVTAIMAFKRIAKFLKQRYGGKQVKTRKTPDMFRKMAIVNSAKVMVDTMKGMQTFTYNKDDSAVYINNSKAQKGDGDGSAPKAVVPKKKHTDSTTIIINVARHLHNHFSKSMGKNVTVAAKLKRNLRVKFGMEEHEKFAVEEANKASGAFESIIIRNNNVKDGKVVDKDDIQENLEYLPGTVIYYGAKVAIQARHGGFLSYHNATEIKASAHKILMQTKFIIINSADLTDFGAVKYGDAIWLQAGQHEVLGANYVVNSSATGTDRGERKIRPALINCRRNNIFKAQQYGRWIILNRDRPTETIGRMVLHYDKIILEQEWYFLASTSPYDAGMHRHGSNMSYGAPTTNQINLFQPDPDCTWKLHLLGLPGDDKGDEKQRQLLLHHAQDQIEMSTDLRFKKKGEIMGALRDSLPPHLQDETYFTEHMKHKRNAESTQKYYVELYSKLAETGFTAYESNSKSLAAIYGKDSKICQLKTDVNQIRLDRHGVLRPKEKVRIPDPRSVLQVEKDKYWNMAQALLIHTRAWAQLNSAMIPYYRIDRKKKIAAAIILQRWIRYLQGKTFSYGRAMRNLDEIVNINLERIRKKAQAAKMLALAPPPGSLEAAQALAASQSGAILASTVPQSSGLADAKPKTQSARRRHSSIINQFKRSQRNRMSFLIKPITQNANICQFPATATTGAVAPPIPGHLLPTLLTPPDSPRDAEAKTDSYRVIPKPVTLANPAPFTGGPNQGRTFITSSSQIVPMHPLSEWDEQAPHLDGQVEMNEDDDSICDDDGDDISDIDMEPTTSSRKVDYVGMLRGQSAPQLSLAKSGHSVQSTVKPRLEKAESSSKINSVMLTRAKSAKLSRDEDVLLGEEPSIPAEGRKGGSRSQSATTSNLLHTSHGKQDYAATRPMTANAIVRTGEPSHAVESLYASASFDVERNYQRPKEYLDRSLLAGLPDDVLNEPVKHLSLHRGLKFLRAASADPNKFKSVVVKKRQLSGR